MITPQKFGRQAEVGRTLRNGLTLLGVPSKALRRLWVLQELLQSRSEQDGVSLSVIDRLFDGGKRSGCILWFVCVSWR
jgi:hypothetical protein